MAEATPPAASERSVRSAESTESAGPAASAAAGSFGPSAQIYALCAANVLILALAVRFWNIDRTYELFQDELTYSNIAGNLGNGHGITLYGQPFYLHPPMALLLYAGAIKAFGLSVHVVPRVLDLRVVSAVCGALAVTVMSMLSGVLTRLRIGLAVGLLLAVDPFFVGIDDQVLLEAPAVLFTTAGMLTLVLLLQRSASLGKKRALGMAVLAGTFMGMAILTKDTYIFVTLVPAIGLFVFARRYRRLLAITSVVSVLPYIVYLLLTLANGDLKYFWRAKTAGLDRVLGTKQVTGFNQAGHIGFAKSFLNDLSQYLGTYALIGVALVAATILLVVVIRARKTPGAVPLERLVALLWASSGAIYVAYEAAFGTLEEKMFYPLLAVAVPCAAIVASMVMDRFGQLSRRRRIAALTALTVMAGIFGYDIAATAVIHATPDNAYQQLAAWAQHNVITGEHIDVTDDVSQFLVTPAEVERLQTPAELVSHKINYVILSTKLDAEGYATKVDPGFLAFVESKPIIFQAHGRSVGDLRVYEILTPATNG